MVRVVCLAIAPIITGCVGGRGGPGSLAAGPGISYVLKCDARVADPSLRVEVRAWGLDTTTREVHLLLPNFGEWHEVDALYVRNLEGEPGIRMSDGDPGRWEFDVPEGWDGSLRASYSLPLTGVGSRLHQRHGLLPWHVPGMEDQQTYATALSENTLARIVVGDQVVRVPTEVEIHTAPGAGIASGWAGGANGAQSHVMEAGLQESPYFFGSARAGRTSRDGAEIEVFQFTAGEDVTGPIVELVEKLTAAYMSGTGRRVDRPVRVFMVDKGGGQWMQRGLLIQRASAEEVASPYYRHLVAHELFHQWLGGYAHAADESLVWFQEGFTDYLSLLHLTQTGMARPEWFLERLQEINQEARSSAAHGKIAFGDPAVGWRDGDGTNETLAYKGGAILAFCIDAALFEQGQPRLARLIGELGQSGDGSFSLEAVCEVLNARGMGELVSRHIHKPGLPDLDYALRAVGCQRQGVDLGYVGVATTGDGGLGAITGIDPEGPAAGSGLAIGDVIGGAWICRSVRPRIGPEVAREYGFGLDLFDPAGEPVNIAVSRAGEEKAFQVRPRAISGGYLWAPANDGMFRAFLDGKAGIAPRGPGRPGSNSSGGY